MSFDPNGFMLFYLILAILALAMSILVYVGYQDSKAKHRSKK